MSEGKVNGFQHKPKPPPQTPPVRLVTDQITCRECGLKADDCRCRPGKYVVTCNPAPDSWVKDKFKDQPK